MTVVEDGATGAGGDQGTGDKGAQGDKGTIIDAGTQGAGDKGTGDQGDKGAGDKGQADWRSRLAGEDKELAKTLARYTDEAAFGKAHRALQVKLSSGELKKALADNATPEETATWRKENGIPEKPDGYVEKLALPNGMVLSDADKPIVADFATAALESNIAPAAFNKLVAQYYAIQDKQRAAQEDADARYKQESEDVLRQDWQGADYRANLTAVSNMMAGWPEGLADGVLAARTPDGKKLGNHPAFVKQLAALALELNPAATLVPSGTTNSAKGVEERIAEIRKFRTENPEKYDSDKKLQQEELDLIDADLRMKKRSAA